MQSLLTTYVPVYSLIKVHLSNTAAHLAVVIIFICIQRGALSVIFA